MFNPKSKAAIKLQSWYEGMFGLDFVTRCQPESLGLDANLSYCYTPSGDKHLKRLLRDFAINSNDAILDIGCGKGSAMRMMSQFPFAKVDGIELSTELATIAKRNFDTLGLKNTAVFNDNAALFSNFGAYNLIYLFNPFPSIVMRPVMASLLNSLKEHPREVVIIYLNPICHEDVIADGTFKQIGWYPDHWGLTFAIYSNRPNENSRLKHNRKMRML